MDDFSEWRCLSFCQRCGFFAARGRWRTCEKCRREQAAQVGAAALAAVECYPRGADGSDVPPAGHAERIARYAERAAQRLPLFDGDDHEHERNG